MPTRKLKRIASRHAVLDDGNAFLPDSRDGRARLTDDEAEAVGEEFIAAVTSAEAVDEDARDEIASDEIGGPFLEASLEEAAVRYFAEAADAAEASRGRGFARDRTARSRHVKEVYR